MTVNCLRCSHFKYLSGEYEVGYCELDREARHKIVLGVNNVIPSCPYFNRKRFYDVEFIAFKGRSGK